MKNDVWEIVLRPEGKSVVTSKWIYKIKCVVDGGIEKYKERFVARGFSQKEGVDYEETFAPIARYTSIRTIISLASVMGWILHQMDVNTTFLNGVIEEEVYREQPQSFVAYRKESHVYRLMRQLVINFKGNLKLSSRGSLEFGLVTEREHEALLNKLTWYEMSLIE